MYMNGVAWLFTIALEQLAQDRTVDISSWHQQVEVPIHYQNQIRI